MPDDRHYHLARHQLWRKRVLQRAGYLCAECRKYGRKVEATHAHHIVPIKVDPSLAYTVSNGMALCTACHNRIEPRGRGYPPTPEPHL